MGQIKLKVLYSTFSYVIIAKLSGEAVGSAALYVDKDNELYLSDLEVHPLFRGLGIGFQIVQKSINFATSNGFKAIELVVDPQNEIALNLYKKADFKIIDRNLFDTCGYLTMRKEL